ncbi:integrase [Vibrio cholerae]|nr:integrase [Vibrio cholerae]
MCFSYSMHSFWSFYIFRLFRLVVARECSGQLKLATVLEFSQYNRSDSLGVKPPLY